ncbi:MAG: hypothetical protein ACNYZI_11570 [Anaerolineales bacterium]
MSSTAEQLDYLPEAPLIVGWWGNLHDPLTCHAARQCNFQSQVEVAEA